MKVVSKSDQYEFKIENQTVILDFRGSLYIPEYSVLVMGDLHLFKSSYFQSHSLSVPNTDFKTLERLNECLAHYSPKTLVLNGDTFHIANHSIESQFFNHLSKTYPSTQFISIVGNHEKGSRYIAEHTLASTPISIQNRESIAKNVGSIYDQSEIKMEKTEGTSVKFLNEVRVGPFIIIHDSSINDLAGIKIFGHLHPVSYFSSLLETKSKRRCFLIEGQKIFMPAFGQFTGGKSVSSMPNNKLVIFEKD